MEFIINVCVHATYNYTFMCELKYIYMYVCILRERERERERENDEARTKKWTHPQINKIIVLDVVLVVGLHVWVKSHIE